MRAHAVRDISDDTKGSAQKSFRSCGLQLRTERENTMKKKTSSGNHIYVLPEQCEFKNTMDLSLRESLKQRDRDIPFIKYIDAKPCFTAQRTGHKARDQNAC